MVRTSKLVASLKDGGPLITWSGPDLFLLADLVV